jgi:hypothetical protein
MWTGTLFTGHYDVDSGKRRYIMAFTRRSLLVVLILFISAVIWGAFRPLSTPRIFLNQRRAIMSIREVNLAQQNYSAQHPRTGYACTLSDLGEQGAVDGVLTKAGYHFEIQCPQRGAQKAERFTITAVPVSPGVTGQYALCADQSGEVWYSEHGLVSDCLSMRKQVEKKYR